MEESSEIRNRGLGLCYKNTDRDFVIISFVRAFGYDNKILIGLGDIYLAMLFWSHKLRYVQ